jgi:hypothetical protein
MAYKKSNKERYIQIREEDYLTLVENSMVLNALKIAGVEELPVYQSIHSIIESGRVEIHIHPIKKKYK